MLLQLKRILFIFICSLNAKDAVSFQLSHQPPIGDTLPESARLAWNCFDCKTGIPGIGEKIVVIDFWATWCAPCIAAFPHLNRLKNSINDSNIVWLAITSEQPPVVARFFQKPERQLNWHKITDTTRQTHLALGVQELPQTFVLNRNGKIAWHGVSKNLTANLIDSIRNHLYPKAENSPAALTNSLVPEITFVFDFSAADSGKRFNHIPIDMNDVFILQRENISIIHLLEEISTYSSMNQIIINNRRFFSKRVTLNFSNQYFQDKKWAAEFSPYKDKYLPGAINRNYLLHFLGQSLHFGVRQKKERGVYYELDIADSIAFKHARPLQTERSSFSESGYPRLVFINREIRQLVQEMNKHSAILFSAGKIGNYPMDAVIDITNQQTIRTSLLNLGLKMVKKTGMLNKLIFTPMPAKP